MRIRNTILLFIMAVQGITAQHDFHYSQYYFSGLLINPAYAGSQGALNLTSIYRNQWTGIEGAPQSISTGLHAPLGNGNSNAGLLFFSNRFALTSESRLVAAYAYRLKLNKKSSLSLGLQAGAEHLKNNWNRAQTQDGEDPLFEGIVERSTSFVAGAGLFFKSEWVVAGVSAPVFYNTRKNFEINYAPLLASAGFLIGLNGRVKLKPGFLIKYLRGSPAEADISCTVYFHDVIGIGGGYRTHDAVYGYFDLRLNEQLSAGYCYDYTLSALEKYANGSHEVMLRYLFNYRSNAKDPRYF